MDQLPLALSIHTFVDKYGAYAGFAAIVGLAVLVLIFFAQARETAALREHAGEAEERIRQLEAQLAQLARAPQATRAQAPPVASGAPQASPQALVADAPAGVGVPAPDALAGAPAGVGAPALAAATKVVAGGASAPSPPAATAEGEPGELSGGASNPPAATAAGARNGASPAGSSIASPPFRQPQRALPPEFALLELSSGRRRGWRSAAIGVLAAAVLGGVGAALYVLTSAGAGRSGTAALRARQRIRGAGRAALRVIPSHVTVTVLNGTATSHLALDTARRLQSAGFRILGTGNAASQSHASTEVEYLAVTDRADATAVARALGLGARDVAPASGADLRLACPASGACAAQVIVVAGQDLQHLAAASTATTPTATTTTG